MLNKKCPTGTVRRKNILFLLNGRESEAVEQVKALQETPKRKREGVAGDAKKET